MSPRPSEARLDRVRTQLQETGRLPLAGLGLTLEELGSLAAELGIEWADLAIEDGELRVREPEPPAAPQSFRHYLHGSAGLELRESIERQGVRLSEEAWENMGRPFYEVALQCEVDPDGTVRILRAVTT